MASTVAKPAAASAYAGLLAALAYSLFSITITLFNKSLLTSYKFDSTLTLTLLQGLVTVGSLEFMKWRGWVSFPSFNFKTAWQVLPLSIVFVLYVVVSLVSLGRVNVPMFTALRRLTILFVMAEEYFYFGPSPRLLEQVRSRCGSARLSRSPLPSLQGRSRRRQSSTAWSS